MTPALLATLHDLVIGLGLAVVLGLVFWGFSSWLDRGSVPERLTSERAEPIDLAAERDVYLAERDRHEEDVALRRVA